MLTTQESPTIRRGQWAMTCAVFIEQNSCFFDGALTYSSAVAGGVAGGNGALAGGRTTQGVCSI